MIDYKQRLWIFLTITNHLIICFILFLYFCSGFIIKDAKLSMPIIFQFQNFFILLEVCWYMFKSKHWTLDLCPKVSQTWQMGYPWTGICQHWKLTFLFIPWHSLHLSVAVVTRSSTSNLPISTYIFLIQLYLLLT